MSEIILKKEDNLTYKTSILSANKGSLVLTTTELYFLLKDKKMFSIPVKDIVNVVAQKGIGNGIDHLYISYRDGGKDVKIKIEHFAFWSGMAIGNLSQIKEAYFKAWEQLIEDTRLGKNKNLNDLNDLEKIADLKNKGIISEEEFSAKKKQILGI